MELHILIRELNGAARRGKVIYSAAEPIPAGMTRNHAINWMLAKIKETFPDDQNNAHPPEPSDP